MTKHLCIGFYTPQIDVRGSCIAIYDYAKYNQTILQNQSIIIVPEGSENEEPALLKFQQRFPIIFTSNLEQTLKDEQCDVLYVIKYGKNDNIFSKVVPTIIHCVFDMSEPHGDVYVGVSKSLAIKYNKPNDYLPHMVSLEPSLTTQENLRSYLNIPTNAIVIGRHGGQDTFNLKFVMNTISKIVRERNDIYFLFVNTIPFDTHPQIIHIPFISDIDEKNRFISTCDAHLEAGNLGHTFGLSIAEFSVNNKPIIVYDGLVWNRAHLDILGNNALKFETSEELYYILNTFNPKEYVDQDLNYYKNYTPIKVIEYFNKIINIINVKTSN